MPTHFEERPERVRIGTSGWSYPKEGSWYGVFYPSKRDELKFYSTYFNTAEVNVSFYRLIPPTTARAWARITPPHFEFAVKAWQKFTHPRMHAAATGKTEVATQADLDQFRAGLDPLAEARKLGAVLLQFPASFVASAQSTDYLATLLRNLAAYPLAVELRHRSWSQTEEKTKDLLLEHRATWVVIDEPKFPSSIRQEVEPLAGMLYLRFHGRNREKWWQHAAAWERYDYLYSHEELEPFAKKLRDTAADPRVRVFAFFNNHVRGKAVANALMLRAQLGLPVRDIPPTLKREYPALEKIETGREELKLEPEQGS